jgi:hypothetical protein
MRSTLIAMAALALALGGCNRPDVDHPKTDYTTSLLSRMSAAEIDRLTVPPAPAQRGPIPPNANAADPATNASLAFPNGAGKTPVPTPDNSPDGEHAAVMAEEAAARAPDTAAADEAKRKIYEEYAARGSVAANASGSGTGGLTNGSTATGSGAGGSASNRSSVNNANNEPVAAQSNGASDGEPMANENAPRPATIEKS